MKAEKELEKLSPEEMTFDQFRLMKHKEKVNRRKQKTETEGRDPRGEQSYRTSKDIPRSHELHAKSDMRKDDEEEPDF